MKIFTKKAQFVVLLSSWNPIISASDEMVPNYIRSDDIDLSNTTHTHPLSSPLRSPRVNLLCKYKIHLNIVNCHLLTDHLQISMDMDWTTQTIITQQHPSIKYLLPATPYPASSIAREAETHPNIYHNHHHHTHHYTYIPESVVENHKSIKKYYFVHIKNGKQPRTHIQRMGRAREFPP